MDPADAAELSRLMREAVVHEMPRRRWAMPAVGLLAAAIVAMGVFALLI